MLRGLYRTKVIHGFNTMLILYCFFLGVCYKSHKSLFNEYIEKRSGDDGDNWTAKRPRTMMARDREENCTVFLNNGRYNTYFTTYDFSHV